MIAAVVLAAGRSARFGAPKQLAVFRGKTLLRHTVDCAVDAGCDPIVVVVGAEAQRVGESLRGAGIELVPNARWDLGLGGSIRAGVQRLALRSAVPEAAIFMVCDQPLLTATVLLTLQERFDGVTGRMVVCEYGGALGVPALFERSRFSELLELRGDRGARSVLLAHPGDVVHVHWPEGVIDVDTPEDYAALGDAGRRA